MKKWGAGGRGVEGSTSGVDGGGWETNSSRSVGRGLLACLLDDLVGARPPDRPTTTPTPTSQPPSTPRSSPFTIQNVRAPQQGAYLTDRPGMRSVCVRERERLVAVVVLGTARAGERSRFTIFACGCIGFARSFLFFFYNLYFSSTHFQFTFICIYIYMYYS